MHKTPAQIARSLRAFRNAYRLALLQSVRIAPGPNACEAARKGTNYRGNAVPRLPLAECTCDHCECKYLPIGSDRLRSLYASEKRQSKQP
jgi:hypothetical protein